MSVYSIHIAFFADKHKEIIGQPYMINFGKDNKIMKQLVSTYGNDRITQLIELFFSAIKTDEFLKKSGATIGIFKVKIPSLLLKLSKEIQNNGKGKL